MMMTLTKTIMLRDLVSRSAHVSSPPRFQTSASQRASLYLPPFVIFIALGQINSILYKGYELQVRRYKENDGGADRNDPFSRLLPMTEFISVRYVPILEMVSRVHDHATTLFMPSAHFLE